jgi:hypothetical protein
MTTFLKRIDELGLRNDRQPLDEYDLELASFIQAALTGLLANRGYSKKYGFIGEKECADDGEVNSLCQQAGQIGEEQFYRWLDKVRLVKSFKKQAGHKPAAAVKKFEQKVL